MTQGSDGSDKDQPSQEELAEIRNQVHAALSRMEMEIERITSVLLAARLQKGAPERTFGHEEPQAADPGTTSTERRA